MDKTMGNEGINKLAGVLQNRMKWISEKPSVLDFGTIGEDMSLTTNKFPHPIPKNDYMVCRHLTLELAGEHLAETLAPRDRVLVAWAGDDPCIIDLIYPGSVL